MASNSRILVALNFRATSAKPQSLFRCLFDFRLMLSGLLCLCLSVPGRILVSGIRSGPGASGRQSRIINKLCTWLSLGFLTSKIQITNNPEGACEDGGDNVLEGKCCTDVSYSYFSACQPCSASASWHWKIQLRALLVLAFICSMGRVHPLLFAQIFNSVHLLAPPALSSGFSVYRLSCAFSRSAQVTVNSSPSFTPSVYASKAAL